MSWSHSQAGQGHGSVGAYMSRSPLVGPQFTHYPKAPLVTARIYSESRGRALLCQIQSLTQLCCSAGWALENHFISQRGNWDCRWEIICQKLPSLLLAWQDWTTGPWLLVLHPALLIQQWEEKSNLFLKDKEAIGEKMLSLCGWVWWDLLGQQKVRPKMRGERLTFSMTQ